MAPILSFTAEEAWAVITDNAEDSVMLHSWHDMAAVLLDGLSFHDVGTSDAKWQIVRDVRMQVMKEVEAVRTEGKVGSSLQAEVTVKASGDKYAALASLGEDLRFVFITSQASIAQVASEAEEAIVVTPSTQQKCARCWHYRADVGRNPAHPELCGRCDDNLHGAGEHRTHA